MRYLLAGNYGVGNLGDEALKDYFLKRFPDVEWIPLSATPGSGEKPFLPSGLRSLFGFGWLLTLRSLRGSDGLVFGGGSLFTDVESVRACFTWWCHARICTLLRKPYFLAFQGIGPFRTRVGEWFARWAIRHAALVSVRDNPSAKRCEEWGLNKEIIQSFDPVFSLLSEGKQVGSTRKILIVIPRNNTAASLLQSLTALVHRGWEEVHIVLMQGEESIGMTLKEYFSNWGVPVHMKSVVSLSDLHREVAVGSFVLTERYHGGIAALALGIPFEAIPQAPGDKLDSLSKLSVSPDSIAELAIAIARGEEELRKALKKASPSR
ncbi:MAG: polysaccharide pyruvyl transferase family protein [Candidatus Peregrinibacteria bacterium]|nr:polysaccharide pyruvyl transferase family protein [Candidatus Peregrinibacteria bacterium]